MEALFISTGVVALAEIGDKTQLLAFILAARFRKPLPIVAGIFCATAVNHGLAGALQPVEERRVVDQPVLGAAANTGTGGADSNHSPA